MDYIQAVRKLREIETRYDVMSIKYRNVSIWPFLRIYLMQSMQSKKNTHNLSVVNMLTVVKGIFSYNPFVMFKRCNVWLFNACERRKKLGDKFIHRVSGCIPLYELSTLVFEKNGIKVSHYKKNAIEENNIISESYILLLAHLIENVLRLKKQMIVSEDIIINIIENEQVGFNYKYFTRYLYAQKLAIDFLLKLFSRPQIAVLECPYNLMGYVWSFKEHGIRVLELQHGVLNENHYAYNSLYSSFSLYPDEICVYGKDEYDYFSQERVSYCKRIHKVGLYILERSDKYFTKNIFDCYRSKYSSIIVVAGQSQGESDLVKFVDKAAFLNSNCLFIFLPRYDNEEIKFRSDNILYCPNVNIYEYLKWCDIHMTISSTTCLEAQYFNKPTIFYNLNNMSKEYYLGVLTDVNGVVYINEPLEFSNAVKALSNGVYEFADVFESNTSVKIINCINLNY